jgi:hypothetical protein
MLLCSSADADVIITFTDDGTHTTAAFSGSVDTGPLGAPTGSGVLQPTSIISPTTGLFAYGGSVDRWEGVTFSSPTTGYGSTGSLLGQTLGGDEFQFNASSGRLELPTGYVSGTSITGALLFAGVTVADLGIAPSVYTFGEGQTISVGTAAVPEPSTIVMLLTGGLGLATYRIRRKRTLRNK